MLSIAVGIAAFQLASGVVVTNQKTSPPILAFLKNSDFTHGTKRIQASGRYELTEDIVFDPVYDAATMSWSKYPSDSSTFPQNGGYLLGFFAAITIEADDVTIDCKGHSLAMSPAYHKMQRFFSLIEKASSPFSPNGLPPFHNPNKLPVTPMNPVRVVIENCNLGLTSHYAIHGSGNMDITLRNLKITDFESGGIEINGNAASRVTIEYCDIGPSLSETYSSYLYQAMITDHLMNTLMPEEPLMEDLATKTSVTIRGETAPVRVWFDKLRAALKEYMTHSTGPMAAVAGDGKQLPDSAAVYGILMHTEIAHNGTLQDLFCPDNYQCDLDPTTDTKVKNIKLRHLVIRNLTVKTAQKNKVVYSKGALVGLTGDIFPMTETWDPENCYRYVGNVFTDAQVAAGTLSAKAANKRNRRKIPEATRVRYVGKSYISSVIRNWVEGTEECQDSSNLVIKIWKGAFKGLARQNITCAGDSYDCRGIGAVGIRLDFVKNVEVVNLTLGNFTNYGTEDGAPWCSTDDYAGRDVRGVSTTFVANLSAFELRQSGSFVSVDGGADHAFPGMTASNPITPR